MARAAQQAPAEAKEAQAKAKEGQAKAEEATAKAEEEVDHHFVLPPHSPSAHFLITLTTYPKVMKLRAQVKKDKAVTPLPQLLFSPRFDNLRQRLLPQAIMKPTKKYWAKILPDWTKKEQTKWQMHKWINKLQPNNRTNEQTNKRTNEPYNHVL